jgi:hypothetical protein
MYKICPTCFMGITCCYVNISTFPGTFLTNIIYDDAEQSHRLENRHHFILQGATKIPVPPPILRFTACKESISYLFDIILSHIPNIPWKTAHPVVQDALHFIENEPIPDLLNPSSVSSPELNSRFFKTLFNIPKRQKSQGLLSCEWSGCDDREA